MLIGVILAQRNIKILEPEKVCEHFAVGLYHTPLLKDKKDV